MPHLRTPAVIVKIGVALLRNKQYAPNRNGQFIVDLECSECRAVETVAFSGWSAIVCPSCGAELRRTPYRRTDK
jgi:hypothetical protein